MISEEDVVFKHYVLHGDHPTPQVKQQESYHMALTKEQRVKVEMVIEHHDHWQKSYFWSAKGTNATSRRRTENKESFEVSFKHHGVVYRYVSSVRVSSSNYYYRGEFFEDGVKKNVALFKRLLKTPKKDRKRTLTAKQIESFTTKDLMRIMDHHKSFKHHGVDYRYVATATLVAAE